MKKNIHNRLIYSVVLGILCVAYFSLYINKTFPFQEGWYTNYNELIKCGKIPYRDFYYYLPPLDLLTNHIMLWLAKGSFLFYKIMRLGERILLIESMYYTLTRYYNPQYTWFPCFVGGILGAAQQFELMGDYNQTGQLLFVFLAYTSARFAETKEIKEQRKWLILSGFIIGLQFTLKQTYFVSAIIVYFVILSIGCYIDKNKYYIKYCLYTGIGVFIPISICLSWLFYNDSFDEFIRQVYFTGAKGGIADILIFSIKSLIKGNFAYLSLTLILFMLLLFLWKKNNKSINNWERGFLFLFLISLFSNSLQLFYYCLSNIYSAYIATKYFYLFLFYMLLLAVYLFYVNKKQIKYKRIIFDFLIVLIFISSGFIFCKNLNYISEWIFKLTDSFSYVQYGIPVVMCFASVFASVFLILYFYRNGKLIVNTPIIMILASALSVCYASLMTAKDYIVSSTCWLTIPIMLTLLFNIKIKYNKWKDYACILICLIVTSTCLSQKVMCTYSWWGWEDEPMYVKNESVDIPELKGYKFSSKEKLLYEETLKIINKNTKNNNTILGFPHIAIFNVLTQHIDIDWFVPILFYDVCSDEYAKKAAELIKENPPDIVIWCDMPDCMETHERIFRNGGLLGQRDIQEWFFIAKDNDYEIIGQIENLFIYKLKNNGVKTQYTFIQDSERENITATQ